MPILDGDAGRFRGTIEQGPYLTTGALLLGLKLGAEYLITTKCLHRQWQPLQYGLLEYLAGLMFGGLEEDRFSRRVLFLTAFPFLWLFLSLTVRRLRTVGLSPILALLIVAPFPINILLYILLGALPTRHGDSESHSNLFDQHVDKVPKKGGKLARVLPQNRGLSALAAILLPMPFAFAFLSLDVHVLRKYGWGLFFGIPFVMPMISVILYGYHRRMTWSECFGVGFLWLVVAFGSLLIFGLEGIGCMAMALPLVIPVVIMGAVMGYLIHLVTQSEDTPRMLIVLLGTLPALLGAEAVVSTSPPLLQVRTSVIIAAPPERVWDHILAFEHIPAPHDDWIFATGIAYPMRAEIRGQGVGAVRRCVFSTGPFIEPIEIWDRPNLLRFAVTSSPPPMREWNPFAEVHPPHLDQFLVGRRGQFRLVLLGEDRTLLEGTTWYQHGMWPTRYWKLWSDLIIHRIHRRVLEHIKRSAERRPPSAG